MKIQGFLYGHYDSRGGATFVERPTRDEADVEYVKAFMHHDGIFDTEKEANEADEQVVDEDYLGTATIETDRDIPNGMDIEQGPEDELPTTSDEEPTVCLWVKETLDPAGRFAEHYDLYYGKDCPEGYTESSLGEDAFGVIVIRAGFDTFGDKTGE